MAFPRPWRAEKRQPATRRLSILTRRHIGAPDLGALLWDRTAVGYLADGPIQIEIVKCTAHELRSQLRLQSCEQRRSVRLGSPGLLLQLAPAREELAKVRMAVGHRLFVVPRATTETAPR